MRLSLGDEGLFELLRVVIVALFYVVNGAGFSEAGSHSVLSDSGGYARRLMEYCSTEGGEPQWVDADGTEIFKNDKFCTINPYKVFETSEPCAYGDIAKCVKSSIESTFRADLSDGEFSGPLCVDHGSCKIYFNFYDADKYYVEENRCGYQFGGIAKFNSEHQVIYNLSMSIKSDCLTGRR